MTSHTNAWAELAQTSSNMVKTSLRLHEMLVASGSVIGARMTIMGNAARRPAQGDYAEIGGMVMEKALAVAKVNQVLVDQWSATLVDATEQTQHFGRVISGGRPVSACDFSGLAKRWVAHATRTITRSMDVGGLALAPVHLQAAANARRLRQQ